MLKARQSPERWFDTTGVVLMIPQIDEKHGTDFEAEVGVIVDHVPLGISAEKALSHIKLVVLINDVSLRGLIFETCRSQICRIRDRRSCSPSGESRARIRGRGCFRWDSGRLLDAADWPRRN